MYELSAGTKQSGLCREVAVTGGSTVSVSYLGRHLLDLNKGKELLLSVCQSDHSP